MFKRSERLQMLAWLAAVIASGLAAFCTPAAQPRAEERPPAASTAPVVASPASLMLPDEEASSEESEAGMELMEQMLARFAPHLDPQALRSVQLRWPAPAALLPRLRGSSRSCRRPPYCD